MLDEFNPTNELDGLDKLDILSDETISQINDIVPIETVPSDHPGPINQTEHYIDVSDIKPEVINGISFKGGACVCSCDMSCTVGY